MNWPPKLKKIHPNALVIAPEEVAVTLRQVSPNLRLFWSRQNYMQEFLDNGKKNSPYKQRLELEAIYSFNDDWSSADILTAFQQNQIDLVVVPMGNTVLRSKLTELQQIYSGDQYLILASDKQ